MSVKERGKAEATWRIDQFTDPNGEVERLARSGASLDEIKQRFGEKHLGTKEIKENCLLNEGIDELWTILCSAGGTKFDNGNAYIGVGDSPAAEDPTQTGLQAAVNKLYKAMDGGYPTYGSIQKAIWRSTFGSAEANFAWEEITVANGNSDAATNLNRKKQSMGTKAAGTTWIATLDITLS